MAENLFVPLLRKDQVDMRLNMIEAGLRNNQIKYIKDSTMGDIERRIELLEKAEAKFFDSFKIEGSTTREKAANLNSRIVNEKITLTNMNGSIIQEAILDICSTSYNQAMLDYLRDEIFTEQMIEQEVMFHQEYTHWTEGFIALLNREIKKSTNKTGRLRVNTQGLKEMTGKEYKDLLAKNLTVRARQVVEQKVQEHIRKTAGDKDIPIYDYILSKKGIEVKGNDWRGIIKGLTPTQAKKMEAEGMIDIEAINNHITTMILDYAGNANRSRLSAVIKTYLLENPNGGKYAFFVGNNNKAITGLLGEIQGLYYICSLFGVNSIDEAKSMIGDRLKWLADTYGASSKKMSIDILLDSVGVQVKNTTRDIEDPFYNTVSFTDSKLTLDTLMAKMGVVDEQLLKLVSSLFQTRMFNVEYQYEDGYIQAENLDFRDSREKMEQLVTLTENMLALWMEAAMHIGVNNSAKADATNNANAIYFINGIFYGASDILRQLFNAVKDNAQSGFSITASMPTGGENIVHYLNRYRNTDRKKSMYGTSKNESVDLKINTSFNFTSLLI